MRYIASVLLCSLSGKEPQISDVDRVLSSVGIENEKKNIEKVLKHLQQKNVEELINLGRSKLAAVPVGGGAAVAAAAGAPAAAAAPLAEKKEEKKVEKEDSESDDDMGFGLFD